MSNTPEDISSSESGPSLLDTRLQQLLPPEALARQELALRNHSAQAVEILHNARTLFTDVYSIPTTELSKSAIRVNEYLQLGLNGKYVFPQPVISAADEIKQEDLKVYVGIDEKLEGAIRDTALIRQQIRLASLAVVLGESLEYTLPNFSPDSEIEKPINGVGNPELPRSIYEEWSVGGERIMQFRNMFVRLLTEESQSLAFYGLSLAILKKIAEAVEYKEKIPPQPKFLASFDHKKAFIFASLGRILENASGITISRETTRMLAIAQNALAQAGLSDNPQHSGA